MAGGEGSERIRLFLVDDHPITLRGLQGLFDVPDVEVVGTARGGRDAVAQVLSMELDVVLMDMCLPGMGGVEALRRIKVGAPEVAVILFTAFGEAGYLLDAVRGGAADFLVKDQSEDDFLDRVRRVAAGEVCLTPEAWRAMLLQLGGHPGPHGPPFPVALTERDLLLLPCLGRGATNAELGALLGVGPDAVRFHLKGLFRRMGTSDRTQAVVRALKWGVIRLEDL